VFSRLINKREADSAELAASLDRTAAFNDKSSPKTLLQRMDKRAEDLRNNPPAPSNDNERERED